MSEEKESTKLSIEQQIETGHTKLDEVHEILLSLKDSCALQNAQSNEITALKEEIGDLKAQLQNANDQKVAVAQTLQSNMELFEKQGPEIEKWKNMYLGLKRKVEILYNGIGHEPKRVKSFDK